MDTRSTKFNVRLIIKIIAVVLALISVLFSAKGALDALLHISAQSSDEMEYYFDSVFISDKEDTYNSNTFDRHMRNYLYDLNRYITFYGDGSRESFEKRYAESSESFKEYKKNLLTNIYYDTAETGAHSYDLLCIAQTGVITLELHKESKTNEDEGDSVEFFDEAFIENFWMATAYKNQKYNEAGFEKNTGQAAKLGGDLLLELPFIEIENLNTDEYYTMPAGTYILKVNDAEMAAAIRECNGEAYFSSYEEYKKASSEDAFRTMYKNIYYQVILSDGTQVTNDKKQTAAVSDYGFYLKGSDGEYKSNKGNVYLTEGFGYGIYSDFHITINHSPTQVGVTQVAVHTTVPDEVGVTTYETTVPIIEQTTSFNGAIAEPENYELAVYFNNDAEFDGITLSQMQTKLLDAGVFTRDAIKDLALGLGIYLLMLILLMVLCGRRSAEDETVYLLPTDKIFAEFKLVISGALICLLGIFTIEYFEEYRYMSYSESRLFYCLLVALAVICAAMLTELIVSLTKRIKARKFADSFLIVWIFKVFLRLVYRFIKKAAVKIWKCLKALLRLIASPVKRLKGALNSDKLYYARNVEQTVKIKTAILVAANVLSAFFCFCLILLWGGINRFGELIILCIVSLPAIALDVLALIRGLSFVGGVSRIADVIKEYRKGNLDAPINRAGLPSYLIETGENLESLGEGIKLAVNEAVKQETTKTELITNISHDLKTPLTSIINYVDLLKKCDIQDETAVSYLEVLGEKSDRLKNLITDLVEASKAATGNIEVNLVSISLREILTQLIGEFGDAFAEKNLDVILSVPDGDIIVNADNKLLYRVFENLATNIKKYSMPSTRVYISAEKREGKGVAVFKNISNAPLNISPEELKQRFVRGDASRATDGNGLGLSIAENLCIVQGGTLDIDITGDLFIARVELDCK